MVRQYWIMDGRANYDIDRAMVLVIHDTLEEVKNDIDNWPDDSVIVKVEGDEEEIIYL